jgi:hypothetical protein
MSITGCCLIICVLVTEFYLRKGSGPDEDDIAREKLGPRTFPGRSTCQRLTVAVAGAFLDMPATFDPYAGSTQLIFAFEAVVIGGTGSLWGTLWGGIVLGVCSFGSILSEGHLYEHHQRCCRSALNATVGVRDLWTCRVGVRPSVRAFLL